MNECILFIVITIVFTIVGICAWRWLNSKEQFCAVSPASSSPKYRLLVSAQCSPYQDWQSVGVYYSMLKNWPAARYTRLLSCDPNKRTSYRHYNRVPSFITSDWSIHPTTKDSYPPYNRPISIKEYLDSNTPEEEYMVVIDPDTIVRRPLDDLKPALGKPIAQRYDYLNDKNALREIGKKIIGTSDNLQPLGMPMIIHRDDLKRLAPLWVEYTEAIRNDPETKDISGWIAEMHSYCLAAAKLGLSHTVRNDLADRTPYDRITNPYVLHYDLRHKADGFSWDKRDYMQDDLLEGEHQFPSPKKSPNDYFQQVFDTINEALRNVK